MKQFFVSILILAACSVAVMACGDAAPRDELGRMVDAEFRATESALQLKRVAVEATSRADATRQYLIVQGQQTRVAQEAEVRATDAAARARATDAAAQRTATAHAQSIAATATAYAAYAQATQASASATAVAHAADARATQVSASATATSNAMCALQTRTSADATATVIAAGVKVEEERAEWNRRLESGRSIVSSIVGALAVVGLLALVGLAVIRFIDAGVLRARVLRDKTGTILVISERDKNGRQAVLIPGRSPGAVLTLTPPDAQPMQIEAGAVDADTTKRDQAVSLMIAATRGKGDADELLDELTDGEQVRFVDEPPTQLVDGDVRQLLDARWKELSDGKSNDES